MSKTTKDAQSAKDARGVELKKASPKTDPREESKRTGEVTTDEGLSVEATSPAIPHGAEYAREEDEGLTREEQEKLCGDLEEGDEGYLPTDAEGNVTGPAVKDRDKAGEWAVKVFYSPDEGHLLTPSGAPISKRMNPDSKLEDNTYEATEAQNT